MNNAHLNRSLNRHLNQNLNPDLNVRPYQDQSAPAAPVAPWLLPWNTYLLLVISEMLVSLVAWLMLNNLFEDPGLRFATGMIVLTFAGITAVALRRMADDRL